MARFGTKRGDKERGAASVIAGMATLLLCLGFLHTNAGAIWERRTLDTRFLLRGARKTNVPIVIIAADDATEKVWSEPTLFWGTHYGRVLQNAHDAGAKVIAIDVVPAVDGDAYLEGLGVSEEIRPDMDLARALMSGEGSIVLAYLQNVGKTPVFPSARHTSLPPVAENIGAVDLLPDADGVVRAMPYYVADAKDTKAEGIQAAFAPLAAARFRHGASEDAVTRAQLFGTPLENEKYAGVWTQFLVNWTGRDFFTISAAKMEQNDLTDAERAQLKGALVFVGLTAAISNDRYKTPFGGITDGVRLHADAAATLLDGCALRGLGAGANFWLCAGLGVLTLWAGATLPSRFRLGVVVVAGGAALGASQWAFARQNVVLPMGGLLLCGLIPCGVQQAIQAVEERIRRQQFQSLLGRTVSPQVRDYLMQSPERLQLNGVEREAVILFFDIRGSLTFAESRTPTETLGELNAFFAQLVPVLEKHGGLLYRYTGDGFLAVFGAPDDLPDAAGCAVRACVGLVDAVRNVNALRENNNKPPLPVGCGLHKGPVICGNLGVTERSDFTVIGDVVNRAARLESCNKGLKSEIVLSRAVWDALDGDKPAGFVGPETVAIVGSVRGEVVFFRRAAETD